MFPHGIFIEFPSGYLVAAAVRSTTSAAEVPFEIGGIALGLALD